MRTVLSFFAIVLIVTSVGCKKQPFKENLNGVWLLRDAITNYPKDVIYPINDDDYWRFTFNYFEHYEKHKLISSGKFEIIEQNSNFYYLQLNNSEKVPISLEDGKLRMDYGLAADGIAKIYEKIK